MQKRHKNKEQYFNEQGLTSKKFVVPFISDLVKFDNETTVLEIGCAEAGNLKPFVDMGCRVQELTFHAPGLNWQKNFTKTTLSAKT